MVGGGLLTTRKTDIVGKQWVTTGLLKTMVPPEGQWFLQWDPRPPSYHTISIGLHPESLSVHDRFGGLYGGLRLECLNVTKTQPLPIHIKKMGPLSVQ